MHAPRPGLGTKVTVALVLLFNLFPSQYTTSHTVLSLMNDVHGKHQHHHAWYLELHWPLHYLPHFHVHKAKQAKRLALPLFPILPSNCAQSTTHMAETTETMPTEMITLLIMPIHHPPVTSMQRDEQGSPQNTFCLTFPLHPSWPRPEFLSGLSFDTQVFAQVFPWLEGLLPQPACCKCTYKMFDKHPLCTSHWIGFNRSYIQV